MERTIVKFIVAVSYASVVFAGGWLTGTTSQMSWAMVTGLALLPAAALFHLWNDPAQSMSELINEARR